MTSSLKFLAFFLSLPLVLLSWSLITFALAVATYAFYESWKWWNYTLVGIAIAIVTGVVGSSLSFFWGIFDESPTNFASWWSSVWPPRRSSPIIC